MRRQVVNVDTVTIALHMDDTNIITHLVCFLVENNGQCENRTPFFQRGGKRLPVAVELARLQTNGRRGIVARVTQALRNSRYVTDVGTNVLHTRHNTQHVYAACKAT